MSPAAVTVHGPGDGSGDGEGDGDGDGERVVEAEGSTDADSAAGAEGLDVGCARRARCPPSAGGTGRAVTHAKAAATSATTSIRWASLRVGSRVTGGWPRGAGGYLRFGGVFVSAVGSTFNRGVFATQEDWKKAMANSDVRFQSENTHASKREGSHATT